MKSIFKKSIINWLILFALYNLVVFALPGIFQAEISFNHTFWILYTIVTVALAVQLIATWFVLQDNHKERLFLHLPLIKICSRGTFAIAIIGICAMIIPGQMHALRFAAAFVCLMISGLSAVSTISGLSAAELVSEVDAQAAAKTAYIRKISAQARPLTAIAEGDAHRNAAQKVYEALRYSDPAYHEDLIQAEEEISVSLEVFADAIRRHDASAEQLAKDLLAQIAQRNALCRELNDSARSAENLQASAADIDRKQKFAAGFVCLIAAVGCVFTLWLYPRVIEPAQRYQSAIRLMETGEYDRAAEAFEQMGQYKDAAVQKQEAYYLKANDLLLKGDLENARTMFLGLGNYRDSADLILECDFREAADLYIMGEYRQALAAFELLTEHEQAPRKIQECRYAIAKELLAEGRTDDAESQLALLGDYLDAAELLKDIRYEKAKNLLNSGSSQEAIAIFASLDGYKESNTYLDFIPEELPEDTADRIYIRKITGSSGASVTQILTVHKDNRISLKETRANGTTASVYTQKQGEWDDAAHTLTIEDYNRNATVRITFKSKLALMESEAKTAAGFCGYFEMED